MGLKQFTPPSMKGLNYNIDADLIMNGSHGVIRQGVTDNILSLRGGTNLNTGAAISLYGWETSDGEMIFRVPGPATPPITSIDVMKIEGHDNANAALLDLLTHRIINIGQATTDMDAAPVTKMWQDWNPTLTWSGATPSTITKTCRYCQIGKVVHFQAFIYCADGNNATGLTISLPVNTVTSTYPYTALAGWVNAGGANYTITAYANYTGQAINFATFHTLTGGASAYVAVAGSYEAA